MTALPQYQFALEIDTNPDAPKLIVSDVTHANAVVTYTQPLPRSGLPYTLLLWHPPQAPETLTIVPADPLIRQLLTNWDETVKAAICAGTSNNATAPAAAPKQHLPISGPRDTRGPQHWLELTLEANTANPILTVKDTTDPHAAVTSSVQLPDSKPPYVLEVSPAPQSSNRLIITPRASNSAFDANVTSGRSVLQFSASISDHRLTTRDDTRYTIKLKNVSEYYIAEEIEVRLVLSPITKLTDGSDPLLIVPTEQRVRCIDPGAEHDVVFSVVTRGIRPGHYPLRVHLTYRIVYWDGRHTSTTYSQALSVQE